MTHTRLWVAATIIAVIILAGFVLSVPRTRDVVEPREESLATSSVPQVTVRDVYKKGVHTISGTAEAPNPCTSLSATATLETTASGTPAIIVAISMPKDTGICIQQVASLPYSTSISAPPDAPISVLVNGEAATVL